MRPMRRPHHSRRKSKPPSAPLRPRMTAGIDSQNRTTIVLVGTIINSAQAARQKVTARARRGGRLHQLHILECQHSSEPSKIWVAATLCRRLPPQVAWSASCLPLRGLVETRCTASMLRGNGIDTLKEPSELRGRKRAAVARRWQHPCSNHTALR